MSQEKDHNPSQTDHDQITYQTHKIPWWIHVMWATFAICSVTYLLAFALKDFSLWW